MTKALLRKQIHKYVDQVDEKTLRLVNAMLSEAVQFEENNETLLVPDQIKEPDRKVKPSHAGEMKMQPWGKVKK